MTEKVNNMVDQIIQDCQNDPGSNILFDHLASTKANGLTFHEAVQVYIECIKISGYDGYVKVVEGSGGTALIVSKLTPGFV